MGSHLGDAFARGKSAVALEDPSTAHRENVAAHQPGRSIRRLPTLSHTSGALDGNHEEAVPSPLGTRIVTTQS